MDVSIWAAIIGGAFAILIFCLDRYFKWRDREKEKAEQRLKEKREFVGKIHYGDPVYNSPEELQILSAEFVAPRPPPAIRPDPAGNAALLDLVPNSAKAKPPVAPHDSVNSVYEKLAMQKYAQELPQRPASNLPPLVSDQLRSAVKATAFPEDVRYDQPNAVREIMKSFEPRATPPRSRLPALSVKEMIDEWDSAPAGAQLRQEQADRALDRELVFSGELQETHESDGELQIRVGCKDGGRVYTVMANTFMSEQFKGIHGMRRGTPVKGYGRLTWIGDRLAHLHDCEVDIG